MRDTKYLLHCFCSVYLQTTHPGSSSLLCVYVCVCGVYVTHPLMLQFPPVLLQLCLLLLHHPPILSLQPLPLLPLSADVLLQVPQLLQLPMPVSVATATWERGGGSRMVLNRLLLKYCLLPKAILWAKLEENLVCKKKKG